MMNSESGFVSARPNVTRMIFAMAMKLLNQRFVIGLGKTGFFVEQRKNSQILEKQSSEFRFVLFFGYTSTNPHEKFNEIFVVLEFDFFRWNIFSSIIFFFLEENVLVKIILKSEKFDANVLGFLFLFAWRCSFATLMHNCSKLFTWKFSKPDMSRIEHDR